MTAPPEKQPDRSGVPRPAPTVSAVLSDGTIIEMIYQREARRTAFAVWQNDHWTEKETIATDTGEHFAPFSPNNNLLKHGVVLLPSRPEEYGTDADLIRDIRAFLHRYVDVSPPYEQIASYYVLFTWVYDRFNELPYLRVRGDPGSGKSRFLLTVGSLCYKPIFASGASTVSPIFRLIDTFRGTLVVDESDWKQTDEKAEVVKILNNGNGRGFPVLRSEATGRGEFNPRAYAVFGPKLIATRGYFDDRALESRCLTEDMGQQSLRDDIPINLPDTAADETQSLRNKLLLFRFRNLRRCVPNEALVDRTIEPRLNQIFVPLLSIIEDGTVRNQLKELARRHQQELVTDRGMSTEAQVIEVINELLLLGDGEQLSIKEITSRFIERFGDEYDRKVTNRWIGNVLRKRLGLKPYKSDGTFIIAFTTKTRSTLERLATKHGITLPATAAAGERTPSEPTPPDDLTAIGF
jgi:hypothetical protein